MTTRPIRTAAHRLCCLAAVVVCFASTLVGPADAASRIKDLVDIEGIRENQLVGYGLVVGLNGTGDTLNNSPFTRQSLQAMLERLGVNTRGANLRTANVAAVMVTGNLPPFAAHGTRMDVTISALGDATSLEGGTLLVTPLVGADGEVYAVAQGSLAVGGFSAQGEAASITRGVPTVGRIANGALVEREIAFDFASTGSIRMSLRNPDLTTAKRISRAINTYIGKSAAEVLDPSTVVVAIAKGSGGAVDLLTEIEQLRVEPDQIAKVVIDEQSGIIVMGAHVRVSQVAIAQGNLTVTITETPQVSQAQPFANRGETVTVPRSQIAVDDEKGNRLAIVGSSISLNKLVDGLNALGIGPRDMIAILQTIKVAGALQAEIEVM